MTGRARRARHVAVALGAVASSVVAGGNARAHRPLPPRAFWAGLDDTATHVPGDGVRVLRPRPGGRVRIPGGTFLMGSTAAAMTQAVDLCLREIFAPLCHDEGVFAMVRAEGIAHPVTLRGFEMDVTEVTVADYARCVSAGTCTPPDFAPDDPQFARADFPITHVRWDDADAYCHFRGGRLPTEAEWEFAARGSDARIFPWGNVYNPHLANHGSWADDPADATDGFAGLAPVGSFPDGATPLGLLDMAGNVAEWVADVYESDGAGLPVPYAGAAETDPKAKTTGGVYHIIRGGSFDDGAMWLRSAARDTTSAPRPAKVGFRCVADLR